MRMYVNCFLDSSHRFFGSLKRTFFTVGAVEYCEKGKIFAPVTSSLDLAGF